MSQFAVSPDAPMETAVMQQTRTRVFLVGAAISTVFMLLQVRRIASTPEPFPMPPPPPEAARDT